MENKGYNVLIVGSGKFGKHYDRIISQLDRSNYPIDNVIISRTSEDAAVEQAKSFEGKVVGVQIRNKEELDEILERYKPRFTAITAKDPNKGDDIHPDYVQSALRYGDVLCEKPFANAKGDGNSMRKLESINPGDNKLGLELPFAVVYNHIKRNKDLYQKIVNADKIRFAWVTNGSGNDVIDNLVLHPWSLIPVEFGIPQIENVENSGDKAKISLKYNYKGESKYVEIELGYGGNFTGFEIDGKYTVGIKRKGVDNTLIYTGSSLEEAMEKGNDGLKGKRILNVKNPLEQNIIASLKGEPIAGMLTIHNSQLILEMIHKKINAD